MPWSQRLIWIIRPLCVRLEAILEQEAFRHGLEISHAIALQGEQCFLLIGHGGQQLSSLSVITFWPAGVGIVWFLIIQEIGIV